MIIIEKAYKRPFSRWVSKRGREMEGSHFSKAQKRSMIAHLPSEFPEQIMLEALTWRIQLHNFSEISPADIHSSPFKELFLAYGVTEIMAAEALNAAVSNFSCAQCEVLVTEDSESCVECGILFEDDDDDEDEELQNFVVWEESSESEEEAITRCCPSCGSSFSGTSEELENFLDVHYERHVMELNWLPRDFE